MPFKMPSATAQKPCIARRARRVLGSDTRHRQPTISAPLERRKRAFMTTKTDANRASRGERRERFETSSGIVLPNDFNPSNTEPPDYERDLGSPGEFPYTRGVRRSLYRGRFWTMRQYAGYATAEE